MVESALIESSRNHIDTSDFYGPHVTNQIIREALHPYVDDLVIVTKVGARRGVDGSWIKAADPDELVTAVHDNLRNLDTGGLHAVNFRAMFDMHGPAEGSIGPQVEALARLQERGLIRHVGISNVTAKQVAEAQAITQIICVQNQYNLVQRSDDPLLDELSSKGIAYVPFFPLGGFTPIQSSALSRVAERLGATPMQIALAWLLCRAPNILLIPGTSSVLHLRENLAASDLDLDDMTMAELDAIGNRDAS